LPATGQLGCFWQVVPVDSAAAETPRDELDDRADALVGRQLQGQQAGVPAGGDRDASRRPFNFPVIGS